MPYRKPRAQTAVRSHRQVAEEMTRRGYPMGAQRVLEIERSALAKLFERLKEEAQPCAAN